MGDVPQSVIKCECCGVNNARIKDYRDIESNKIIYVLKFAVCRLCFNLNDAYFFRMLHAKSEEELKNAMREIVEAWNLKDYHDEKDPVLNEEIKNWLKYLQDEQP